MDELSGTKELIFDAFIEMTSSLGFENVSMRNIADKVGIRVASIYNHYESKAKILEYAYNYYSKQQCDNRKPLDEIKKLIETLSAEEILTFLTHSLETDDPKKHVRMGFIRKIIYMRLFQDQVANAIFEESNSNNAEYVIYALKHGIETGRIESSFDLEIFADLLICSQQAMGIKTFADPSCTAVQLKQQKRIIALMARLLSSAMK